MLICPNCGKELAEGTAFCDNCGTAIPAAPAAETVFCANCGTQTDASSEFCQNCGAALNAEAAPAPAKKFQITKKMLTLGAAAVAALALIVVVLCLVFSGGKKDLALYLKDDEIWTNNFAKKGTFEVTSKLLDGDNAYMKGYCILSKDNKTLFFPDKIDSDGYTLYYRDITKKDSEAFKIDADVEEYTVSKDGKIVTYQKNEKRDADLGTSVYDVYQYDMKKQEKSKVASDVQDVTLGSDGKTLFYINDENELFVKQVGKDKVKLSADVYSVVGVSENNKTVYYKTFEQIEKKDDDGNVIESYKEFDLFKQKIGKDKENIAKDVDSVYFVDEDEVLFYVTAETKKVAATTFVEDNVKNNKDYDENDKERYAEIWEFLKGEKVEVEEKTLFFFDGKGSIKLIEQYHTCKVRAAEAPVMLVEHGGTYEKMELSSLYNKDYALSRVQNHAEYASVEDASFSVAMEKYVSALNVESVDDVDISDDGKLMYILTGVKTEREAAEQPDGAKEPVMENIPTYERTGDMVEVKIGKKAKLTVNEKYDTDVAYYTLFYFTGKDDDMFVYAKDVDDSEEPANNQRAYTLFADGKEVESDVLSVGGYSKDAKGLLFVTDRKYDDNGNLKYYALKLYNGKKVVKVADELYSYTVMPSGKILFLADYNLDKGEGDLYVVKAGKKAEKLDEEVSRILSVTYLADLYE